MATKSKKKPAAARKRRHPLTEPRSACGQYVYLRTLLDSAEVGSIRYFLDGTTPAEKEKRLATLEPLLRQVINLVWGGAKQIPCPPGYTSCDGCCVPYSCFFGGD